jgi:hypothetical protein
MQLQKEAENVSTRAHLTPYIIVSYTCCIILVSAYRCSFKTNISYILVTSQVLEQCVTGILLLCDEDKLTSPEHQTRCFGCHLSPEFILFPEAVTVFW